MEDLIRNAHTLFDEHPSQPPPVPFNMAEATSTDTYGLSPGFPHSTEIYSTGSTSRHRPRHVNGIHASAQSSFSTSPSDGAAVNLFTPPQNALMSPLRGLSLSRMPTEGVQTNTQERPTKTRGTEGKSRQLPYSEAPTILLRLSESSIPSRMSEFLPPPSNTSSRTMMLRLPMIYTFSPNLNRDSLGHLYFG